MPTYTWNRFEFNIHVCTYETSTANEHQNRIECRIRTFDNVMRLYNVHLHRTKNILIYTQVLFGSITK